MFGILAALTLAPRGSGAATTPAKPAAKATAKAAAGSAVAASANAPFWAAKPTAAQFAKLQTSRLAAAKASIARMTAVKGARTIDNTLRPYDEALRQLDLAGSQSSLVQNTHPVEAYRTAAEKAAQDVSAFGTALSLNREVFDALSALDTSKEDAATQYYVKRTLRDFRLAGVDKDQATRDQIKKLSEELVEISQEFSRNIREDKRGVTAKSVAELDGLPKAVRDWHKPEPDGSIKLTIAVAGGAA